MRRLALALIKAYRYLISPLFGNCCRFYPSCSEYAETAVRRHGAIKGGAFALSRVLRCNPWNAGGVDHVPGTCEHKANSNELTAITK